MSGPLEIDHGKVLDPFGARRVMDAIRAVREKRASVEVVAETLLARPILIPRDHPYAPLLGSLAALFEEILTGRGLEVETSGEPVSADLMTEVADILEELSAGKGLVQLGGEDGAEED